MLPIGFIDCSCLTAFCTSHQAEQLQAASTRSFCCCSSPACAHSMLNAVGSRIGLVSAGLRRSVPSSLASRALSGSVAQMSTQTPPPDAARGATADLCDTFIKDPVDIVNQGRVQIMNPVFRDFGGHLRFNGQAATVKCFENNPLVRQVSSRLSVL